ncbi:MULTISPECIES: Wzz/FepE/Etk N-terminal domain-containing protein [Staphylococcus]|uniref:Wzz/FepE/Etk N-terminal domain-containing protein n=1 Tax=Staphylococcus TaxID=1279 RepID=UPI00069F7259|nr:MULTISPECIES: Wzz/FepE/Etk N-terminal domain-containing protein [Staphylococcus]KAA2277058.1 capsule biosynthesis protein CapA [Staphylococcus sp. GDX7P312P]KAA2279217.1 capsule biosynthesis protein CapA [Staphylococcus sp. GDX7P459A]KQC17624.1 capsule biosynthesis protein CapA [Staphylococcus haemolyticus]MBK3932547.1 capsule biosynthesis protein CapA [Staphylococcus haemolyticus]MCE4953871.1 capsule biosynthesis protein CapA [Staphylococcus haemolyticus]
MENTLDFTKIWEIIKKNWKLLVLLPIVFLLISLVYTFFIASPKYEASTQVLVNEKEKDKDMMAQQVQSNIQLVNTYSEILKSPRILDEVAKDHKEYSTSQLNKMVSVNTEAESQILNLSVRANSEEKSEKITNDVAKVFKKQIPDIMNVDNVTVLSSADGTASKVSPKTLVNIVGSLLLGLIVAAIIIALKEIFDKRIRTEEDVEKELEIPVLGSIPMIK